MNTTEQSLIEALRKIREIGYNSKITRTPETVLQIVRIAESALEAEREAANAVARPAGITSWTWYHFSFADLSHWQNCLVAAANAGASDVTETALKMYVRQGGKMRVTRTGRVVKPRRLVATKGAR